jgi:hypothetical protein
MPTPGYPNSLLAVPAKTLANGANPQTVLQPAQRMAAVAVPVDLATCITAITAIITGLKAEGLMN